MGSLDFLDRCGDFIEGIIPADGLELVLATLAHALERRLDATCAVNVLDLG